MSGAVCCPLAVAWLRTAALVLVLALDPPCAPRVRRARRRRRTGRRRCGGARRVRAAGRAAVRDRRVQGTEYPVREQGGGHGAWRVRRGGPVLGVRPDRVRLAYGLAGPGCARCQIAVAAAVVLLLFALGDAASRVVGVTMRWRSARGRHRRRQRLAFTSTAELPPAGVVRRALGIQNTAERVRLGRPRSCSVRRGDRAWRWCSPCRARPAGRAGDAGAGRTGSTLSRLAPAAPRPGRARQRAPRPTATRAHRPGDTN
ncbi:hypothetical protein HBB16_12125 [Pseudonocardia sp. MCCB 268]|nr:hypothetical protein [Pseudonocardia cytotoxica]